MLLRLLSVITLIYIYLIHSVFKGGNPVYVISFLKQNKKQPFNVGLYSDIYRPISFKRSVIMSTKLYTLISVH